MDNFRNFPIPEVTLPWTDGLPDGNDDGYRGVGVAEEAQAHPDPLVELPSSIRQHPVYALGALRRVCPYYGQGLGASPKMLARQPMVDALLDANRVLQQYGRQLLVLDAFRPMETQRRLFAYILRGLLGESDPKQLTVTKLVTLGMRADDVGSYVALDATTSDDTILARETTHCPDQIRSAVALLNEPAEEVRRLYVTFMRNLGFYLQLKLDFTSNTAHGGGGATDAILVDFRGNPMCLGNQFDYIRPSGDPHPTGPAAMRFFEDEGNLDYYRDLIGRDATLRNFLAGFYNSDMTLEGFRTIQRERRLFYHCMTRCGFSFFNLECWHWNAGNERGGNQRDLLPFAGNGCHSLLKHVCRLGTDQPLAVWGSAWVQKEANKILGAEFCPLG